MHVRDGFADGESPDCVSIKIEVDEVPGCLFPKLGIAGALHDAEISLAGRAVFLNPFPGFDGPFLGQSEGVLCVVALARVGRAFVENHADVAANGALDLENGFRREKEGAAVDVTLEADPVFRDLAELGERKDLVTA